MFDINVTVTLVSYIKSDISHWRTGAWCLKPFKERVEKTIIYNLVKLTFTKN